MAVVSCHDLILERDLANGVTLIPTICDHLYDKGFLPKILPVLSASLLSTRLKVILIKWVSLFFLAIDLLAVLLVFRVSFDMNAFLLPLT